MRDARGAAAVAIFDGYCRRDEQHWVVCTESRASEVALAFGMRCVEMRCRAQAAVR